MEEEFGEWNLHLVLREFNDILPGHEFRGFVYKVLRRQRRRDREIDRERKRADERKYPILMLFQGTVDRPLAVR